jgi:hypothetical protein
MRGRVPAPARDDPADPSFSVAGILGQFNFIRISLNCYGLEQTATFAPDIDDFTYCFLVCRAELAY